MISVPKSFPARPLLKSSTVMATLAMRIARRFGNSLGGAAFHTSALILGGSCSRNRLSSIGSVGEVSAERDSRSGFGILNQALPSSFEKSSR